MKSNIMKKIFLKNVLLISCLSAAGFISEDYSFFDANALIAKTKANAEKVKAVNEERSKWEPQVKQLTADKDTINSNLAKSENDLKVANSNIKTLQNDLNKALEDSKKLSSSKAESEKLAGQKLSEAKAETQKIMEEKEFFKKSSEEEAKKLNDSIVKLQNDIKAKEQERADLNTKFSAAEKSRKDYEAKVETEKKSANQKFEAEKNKLNEAIKLKTKQLVDKNNELKNLKNTYSNQSLKTQNAESINLIDIDILKNEVNSLKSDLRNIINSAKKYEAEKNKQEVELIKKHESEKKYLTEIILKTQSIELNNLKEIDSLKLKLKDSLDRQNQIIEAGRQLEFQYKLKIEGLLKELKSAKDEYIATVESNKLAELKNLATIDNLKSKLEEAIKLNTFLISKAKMTAHAKSQEDAADSQVEVKGLLKIDVLETALSEAISKNNNILENSKKVIEDSLRHSQAEKEIEKKYLQTIDKLTSDVENSNKTVREMLKTGIPGKWTIKQNFFGKSAESIIGKGPCVYNKNEAVIENGQQTHLPKAGKKNSQKKINEKNWIFNKLSPQNGNITQPNGMRGVNNYTPQQRGNVTQYPNGMRGVNNYIPQQRGNVMPYFNGNQQQQIDQYHNGMRGVNNYIPQQRGNVMPYFNGNQQQQIGQYPNGMSGGNNYTPQQRGNVMPYFNGNQQQQIDQYPNGMRGVNNYIPQQRGNVTPYFNGNQQQQIGQYPNGMRGVNNYIANPTLKRQEIIAKIHEMQKIETKDDQLVNFAIDSILHAILNMTNEDVEKTNASMNLIGSGRELPQKLDAVIDVVKEQFNPIILEKALKEISKKYQQKKSFIDESLKHIYGKDGDKLIYWNNN